MGFTINNLGVTAYNRHHFEAAKLHYTESLRIARELGDKLGIARALNNLGKTANQQGQWTLQCNNESSFFLFYFYCFL